MKKTLLLCGMLLAISATVASAAGVNIAWENCYGGGGAHSRTFACNTNSGTAGTLVTSVSAPSGINLWTAFEAEYMFIFSAPQPAWWQLRNQTGQTAQCRNGALSANSIGAGLTGCTDPYNGQGSGGIGTYQNGPNIPAGEEYGPHPNRARLLLVFAVPAGNEAPLNADEEYFVAKVALTNAKTVGLGSCPGCPSGQVGAPAAAVRMVGVKCVQPAGAPGGNVEVRGADVPGMSECALIGTTDDGACNDPTPARRATWGSVKALYR